MGLHRGIVNLAYNFMDKNDKKRMSTYNLVENVTKVFDIPYCNDDNKFHLLDIYYPENNDKKLPIIIDIHGGGWFYGTKEINAYYCQSIAKRGFVVVNINYRLIKEGLDGAFPKNIQDVFSAFNWVEKNIERYNGDLNNVFLTGDSAGASFAALAQSIMLDDKLSEELEVSTSLKFNAIALTCGVSDIECFENSKLPVLRYVFKLFFGKDYKNHPHKNIMNIKNNKLESFPPLFLNTAFDDFMKKQVLAFYEECKARGVEVELKYIEKKATKKLGHVYSILFPDFEESKETTDALIAFFNKYIVISD
jgi:acetyl esterase/lipase